MITFYCVNTLDEATITASTENAQFPKSNIQHDFRTKVFRSTSNSDQVTFDLGSTESIDALCAVDNWQDGFGFTAITIEGNATDVWTSPAFSQSFTFDTEFGVGIEEFLTTQSYRFWRLDITSTLGYCELSNLYLGKKTEITTNGVDYNWAYQKDDLKDVSTTRYGQEFIDDITTRKSLSRLSFSVMNIDEMDKIYEVYDRCRTVKPFFLKLGEDNSLLSNNDARFWGQYKMTREPRVTNTTVGFYNVTLNLEEQK